MRRHPFPRRDLLRGLGATAAVGACRGRTGPGDTASPPGTIDTIVMVMMENRSFDHYFGSLSLEEGLPVDGLQEGMSNPDLEGRPVLAAPSAWPCVEDDPPHSWSSSRTQLDDGTNQGFVRAFLERHASGDASVPMSYLTRADLPVAYALADRYTLCQRWFSSLLTSTWPNRLYFHGAQSQGIEGNSMPPEGRFTMTTIWDQLTEAGIEWGYYFTDLPTLALFQNPDHSARIGFFDEFLAQASIGALPPVVCVDPGATFNDDHPPNHTLLGQIFLGSVYQALARSPQWSGCLLAITYDEAGGFFDHVPPGTMPDDHAAEGFDQLGFRVPSVVVGPYVRQVHVSDLLLDHTAPLATVQRHHGLPPLTLRNEHANDLFPLLDEERMATGDAAAPADIPTIELTEEQILAQCDSSRRRSASQPELHDLVKRVAPHLDRTGSIDAIARRLFEQAEQLGVVRIR